jgi:kumamolisin
MIVLPGSNRLAVPQAKLLKKSDSGVRIKVSIYARQNPTGPGKSLSPLDDLNNKLPAERHYLSDEEFNSTFGADPADLDKIAAWAEASKLKVLDRSVAKRRVLVEGTIGDISKALGVQLNEYEHPETGRFRGRVGQIHIPADLFGIVQGVFGLDTRLVGRPRLRRGNVEPVDFETLHPNGKTRARDLAQASPASPFPGTFFPTDAAQLYAYPDTFTGSGQNVAIFAFTG